METMGEIKIVVGDITTLKVDAIVNAAITAAATALGTTSCMGLGPISL